MYIYGYMCVYIYIGMYIYIYICFFIYIYIYIYREYVCVYIYKEIDRCYRTYFRPAGCPYTHFFGIKSIFGGLWRSRCTQRIKETYEGWVGLDRVIQGLRESLGFMIYFLVCLYIAPCIHLSYGRVSIMLIVAHREI